VLDLLGRSVDLLLSLLGTTAKAEDEVQGRLLLDVIVGKSPAVLELLAGEDEALLVGWDALLVCSSLLVSLLVSAYVDRHRTLDLGLHIVDSVRRLHLEGDGLTREGLDENLHGDLL
jgi:hypothetical protein